MVRLFGTEARARLVDTFLRRFDSTMNVEEVADSAGVDKSTVHRHIDVLVDIGLVDDVGDGSTRAFKLNTENEVTQSLGQTHKELLKQSQSVSPVNENELREAQEGASELEEIEDLLPRHLTLSIFRKCLQHSEGFRRELVSLIQRYISVINLEESADDSTEDEDSPKQRVDPTGARPSKAAVAEGINEQLEA